MAAPLRQLSQRVKPHLIRNCIFLSKEVKNVPSFSNVTLNRYASQYTWTHLNARSRLKFKVAVCLASVSSVFAIKSVCNATSELPVHPVSRSVTGPRDMGEQRFTLFQFQSCPYCCKVRAALDYFGFAYDVVEVNSVTKKQLKFSDYKKVPVLVLDNKDGSTVQFNDSSTIVSVLGSYVFDSTTSLQKLHSYFPGLKEKQGRKTVWDFPNKYFIMFGESRFDSRTEKERKDTNNNAESKAIREERKWRRWTDDILMHTISPNVYRTPSESLEAFHHFSEWGEWDKLFSPVSRVCIVYVGALAMFFIGKIVKKRHNIKEDPRESLYDACDEWMKAVGKRKFLGGNRPNLGDISVYGALHSFEGCLAFTELMDNHKVSKWYQRIEREIQLQSGANLTARDTQSGSKQ